MKNNLLHLKKNVLFVFSLVFIFIFLINVGYSDNTLPEPSVTYSQTMSDRDKYHEEGGFCYFLSFENGVAIRYKGELRGTDCVGYANMWRPSVKSEINTELFPDPDYNYFDDADACDNTKTKVNRQILWVRRDDTSNCLFKSGWKKLAPYELEYPFISTHKNYVSEGDCFCGFRYVISDSEGNHLIEDSCYDHAINPLMDNAGKTSYIVTCNDTNSDGFFDLISLNEKKYFENCGDESNNDKYGEDFDYWNAFGPCGSSCDGEINLLEEETMPNGAVYCKDGVYKEKPNLKELYKTCPEVTQLDEVCRFPLMCINADGYPMDPDCLLEELITRNVDSNPEDSEFGGKNYCEVLNDLETPIYNMDCNGPEDNFACGYAFSDAGELTGMNVSSSGIYVNVSERFFCIKDYLPKENEFSPEIEEYKWVNLTDNSLVYFSVKDKYFVSSGVLINFEDYYFELKNNSSNYTGIVSNPMILLCSNADVNHNYNDSYVFYLNDSDYELSINGVDYPSILCNKKLSTLSVCYHPNFLNDSSLNIVNLGSEFLYPGDSVLLNDSIKICDYGVDSPFEDKIPANNNFDGKELFSKTYFIDSYDIKNDELESKELLGGSSCYYKARGFNSIYSGYSLLTEDGLDCCGDDGLNDVFKGNNYFACYFGKTFIDLVYPPNLEKSNSDFNSIAFVNSSSKEIISESILNYPAFLTLNQNKPFNFFYYNKGFNICDENTLNNVLTDINHGQFLDSSYSNYWFCSYVESTNEYFIRDVLLKGFNGEDNCDLNSNELNENDLSELLNLDELVVSEKNLSVDFSELGLLQKNFVGLSVNLSILEDIYLEESTEEITNSKKQFVDDSHLSYSFYYSDYEYQLIDNKLTFVPKGDLSFNLGVHGFCGNFGDYCMDNDTLVKYYIDNENHCVDAEFKCSDFGFSGCDYGVCTGCVDGDCNHIVDCSEDECEFIPDFGGLFCPDVACGPNEVLNKLNCVCEPKCENRGPCKDTEYFDYETCSCVNKCLVQTCDDFGYECGTFDNGCGGEITCGICDEGFSCSANGICEYDYECDSDSDCTDGEVCYNGECVEDENKDCLTVEDILEPSDTEKVCCEGYKKITLGELKQLDEKYIEGFKKHNILSESQFNLLMTTPHFDLYSVCAKDDFPDCSEQENVIACVGYFDLNCKYYCSDGEEE